MWTWFQRLIQIFASLLIDAVTCSISVIQVLHIEGAQQSTLKVVNASEATSKFVTSTFLKYSSKRGPSRTNLRDLAL